MGFFSDDFCIHSRRRCASVTHHTRSMSSNKVDVPSTDALTTAKAEKYIQEHGVDALMQGLLQELLLHKPADPVRHVIEKLATMQKSGQ